MKIRVKNDQAGFTLIEYIATLVIAAIVAAMVSTFFGKTITESAFPILNLQKGENLHQVMENIVSDYNRLHTIDLRNQWKAATPYTVNAYIVPSVNNGYYYKCTTDAAISGVSEPSWPTTANGTVTDGGITWKNSGKVWTGTPPTAYVVGDVVVPYHNNGHFYKCTTAGTSVTGNGPSWPKTTGGTVTETSGPTWTEIGTILGSTEASRETLFKLLPDIGGTNGRYGTGFSLTVKSFIKFNSGAEVTVATDVGTTVTTDERNILRVTIKSDGTNEHLTALFTIR